MSSETKKIAEISFVTDTDVSTYEMGEVNGAFDSVELKKYIKTYGHTNLCERLTFMQFQIWEMVREVNSEKSQDDACMSNGI